MTLCEESLQGLGSFWSRYAGRVRQNVNINQQESVAWKINTLKTGVTSFSSGLCSLTSQPISKGDWTVYFNEPTSSAESSYLVSINTDLLKYNSNKYSTFGVFFSDFLQQAAQREPEVVTVTLNKPLNSGMGVSIVAAKVTASVFVPDSDVFTNWNCSNMKCIC